MGRHRRPLVPPAVGDPGQTIPSPLITGDLPQRATARPSTIAEQDVAHASDAAPEVLPPMHTRPAMQTKPCVEKPSGEENGHVGFVRTGNERTWGNMAIYVLAPLSIACGAILAAVRVDTRALGHPPWAVAGVERALRTWLGRHDSISVQAFIVVLYLYPFLALPLYQRRQNEGRRNRELLASLLIGLAVGLTGMLVGGDSVGSAIRVSPLIVSIGLSVAALSTK